MNRHGKKWNDIKTTVVIGRVVLKVLLVRNFWTTWQPLFYKETESLVVDLSIFCFRLCTAWRLWAPLLMWKWMSSSFSVADELRMVLLPMNKSKAFRNELCPPHNYKSTNIIYKIPPQRSINFVCFFVLYLCVLFFFQPCFICVHNILFLFFVLAFKEGNSVEEELASKFSVQNSL